MAGAARAGWSGSGWASAHLQLVGVDDEIAHDEDRARQALVARQHVGDVHRRRERLRGDLIAALKIQVIRVEAAAGTPAAGECRGARLEAALQQTEGDGGAELAEVVAVDVAIEPAL